MRHPQDDLLIVHALVELAREHRGTPTEARASDLAYAIANQHGLMPVEVPRQLEVPLEAHGWEEDCG
ncbi:hypothetical protein [Natronorubrum daqingense]|uniref:Uncharacterized protein n=1 Tax=Natronorubrum daqingense TaxID=588898 RepID=A0A1N7FEZ0_9EURY|nr:hypothetical protein [Natronorubrum daqingense]APX98392.1 hypothetical protein BB347_16930 [Natronorubrum daqingense]SIR98988.1 hypothetical protein SAMN05421809_3169 [Natronorubrum daqingense]